MPAKIAMPGRRSVRLTLGNRCYVAVRAEECSRESRPLPGTVAWQVIERALITLRESPALAMLLQSVTGEHSGLGHSKLAAPRAPRQIPGIDRYRPLREAFCLERWRLIPPTVGVSYTSTKEEAPRPPRESIAEQLRAAQPVKTWIEMEVVDESGKPMAGQPYLCMLPDGRLERGTLNDEGRVRFSGIDPGNCVFSLTELDEATWLPKR